MRRHFLFPHEDAAEPSVGGDGAQDKSLLRRWLERRALFASDPQVARLVTFFWDVAKHPRHGELRPHEYVALFSRVAVALLDAVRAPHVAEAIARRDWLYDSHGLAWSDGEETRDGEDGDTRQPAAGLVFELFRDALLQVAGLLLPVESDASMVISFLLELRECVAVPFGLEAADSHDARDDSSSSSSSSLPPPLLLEAASYTLRAVRDVRKIRGAFLQRAPPSRDKLADIAGLPPPDSRRMSLKQLLLGYNPRKLALSRAFSTLAALQPSDSSIESTTASNPESVAIEEEMPGNANEAETAIALPRPSARQLNAWSDDPWDAELAFLRSLETFPAPRVAVVGPPLSGKTRLAKLLARKLRLRYLSLESSVQMAVDALRQRRQRRRKVEEEPAVEVAAHDGDGSAPSGEGAADDAVEAVNEGTAGEDALAQADSEGAQVEKERELEEESDPLADLFTSDDLDALLAGQTLSRDRATRLLVHFATASLLAGVGVVLDDVHPLEVRGALGVDFLVSLRASKTDLQQRAAGFVCAPAARVVYSAREVATLQLTPPSTTDRSANAVDPLRALGFADAAVQEDQDSGGALNGATTSAPTRQAASPPVEAGDGQSEGGADEPLESSRSLEEAGEEEEEPKPPTPAERNGISPPSEVLVPLRSLLADFYDARYREYLERVTRLEHAGESASDPVASPAWHEIPILAAQSLAASVTQCIETMSGNELGISRSNASRRATPVNLPAALAPSPSSDSDAATAAVSRADQLRCLLFGDWGDAIDHANGQINEDAAGSLALPSTDEVPPTTTTAPPRWRRLSRWREFCPVTSWLEQRLVLGTPALAATLAGRIYLFASPNARDVFCAHPLQFLRRDPAALASRPAKVWLLHASGGGDAARRAVAELLTKIQQALDLPLVSSLDVLASAPDEQRAVLAAGGVVSAREAAQLVASSIAKSGDAGKWLLTDMPLSSEGAAELQAAGCLPEVVIALDDSPEQDQENVAGDTKAAADSVRSRAFVARLDSAQVALAPLGVAFKRCRIPRVDDSTHVEEALAVILAAVDPLARQVDRAEDGHVPADLLTALWPSSSSTDEAATTLIASVLAPSSPEPTATSALLGEAHRYCAVSWRRRGILVPGLPAFVSCFQQRVYAFAGRQEQRAFDRDPTRYVPSGPRETAPLVPLVLLVGVRGSGVHQIAQTLATASRNGSAPSATTTMMVDVGAVQRVIVQKQKLATLRRDGDDGAREPEMDARLAVEALRDHVESLTSVWRQQSQSGLPAGAAVILLPGVPTAASTSDTHAGVDDVVGGDDPEVPTAELLAACFALGVFPALVLPLEASESVVVQRRLAPWLANEQASRERRARDRALARAIAKRKGPRRGGGDDEGGDGGEEEADEPVDLETARAEQAEKLASEFLADQEAMTQALEALRERGIDVAAPIPADGSGRQRVKLVESAVAAFSARKDALFSPCHPVGSSGPISTTAERQQEKRRRHMLLSQLASGEFEVGKHGTCCPVTDPAALTRVRTSEDLLSHAVVFRDRVYFPGSTQALARFCSQPWAFVHGTQHSSVPPPHALACSVKGAPHTPSTRLAQQLARETGAVYVSPGSAIAWARQCLGGTGLWSRLDAMAHAGVDAVQDSATVHAAVLARLQSAECLMRGWVLDDYVLTPADNERHVKLDNSVGVPAVKVEPGLLLIVDESFQSAWTKAQRQSPDSSQASVTSLLAREQLAAEFSAWRAQRLELIERWTATYGESLVQVLPLDHAGSGGVSFWKLVDSARTCVERHLARVRRHRQLQAANPGQRVTCAVQSIPRTLSALSARRHPSFDTFCPVELRAGQYVVTPISSRTLCVDYGPHSFWLANAANLDVFANDPEAFVNEEASNNARELLAKAPVDASMLSLIAVADCDFPELKGYCPVTFVSSKGTTDSSEEGPRANWAAIVKGSVFFRASYEHKVFLMASEEARRQFLADPSRYMGLKLPVKLPPQVTTALAANYPGRLEQEMGALLQDALLSLGTTRPKFPGASIAASACVFLALTLQRRRQTMPSKRTRDCDDDAVDEAHSEVNGSTDGAVDATLAAFERDCQLAATLQRAVTPCSPSCGPAIRAVRELLASSSSSSLPIVDADLEGTPAVDQGNGSTPHGQLEEARLRFDAITSSDAVSYRAFHEYATSAATKKRERLGIHLSS